MTLNLIHSLPASLAQFSFFDPLEQFEVLFLFFTLPVLGDFTNLSALLFFVLFMIFVFTASFNAALRNSYDYLVYISYLLIRAVAKENLYIKRQQYFVTLFYLFATVFLANLIGLVPYSFTPTSSFVVTFFLALGHFMGINFILVLQNRWEGVNLFLPSGVPALGAPFLVLIEWISYVARVFSLSIRLFANMMSGHALLKILSGFSWALLCSSSAVCIVALLPWITVTSITFLEVLIAFLQAYVFVILTTIYISDTLNMH